MPHRQTKLIGQRLPSVRLGEMIDGDMRTVRAIDALGAGSAVIVGMPGAFTPVCSSRHLPSLVQNADRLRASGAAHVVCIVTSDPWSTDAWAKIIDPQGKVRFLADGNLSFARALGLTTHEPRLMLGERSERYMLTARDGVIESARIESSIFDVSCTNVDEFVLEEA